MKLPAALVAAPQSVALPVKFSRGCVGRARLSRAARLFSDIVTPENPRPEMRPPSLLKDLFPRTWFPGSVGKRQIFHRRLATNGLRIELHQAQDIFWHIIPDR